MNKKKTRDQLECFMLRPKKKKKNSTFCKERKGKWDGRVKKKEQKRFENCEAITITFFVTFSNCFG